MNKMNGFFARPEDIEAAARHIVGTDLPEKNILFSIPANGYLADSQPLKACLKEQIAIGGKKILLRADCSYGKTYLFLDVLSREMRARHFIMLCPFILHTEQNGKPRTPDMDGHIFQPAIVRASDAEKNFFESGRPVVTVYDQALSLLRKLGAGNIPLYLQERLRQTVLVIDEIHLEKEQLNIRHEAITNMELLAGYVTFFGGTVIYLTATPRKLCGFPFDLTITCQKHDEHGNRLPAINAQEVELIYYQRKNSHKYTLKQSLICLILDLTSKGYIPLLRINNKKKIQEYAAILRDHGLLIYTLAADDRGEGELDRRNSMYSFLVRQESLPFSSGYITTSWMDTGVSVKHLLDEDGHKVVNPKVVPIYLVGAYDYDPDKIHQFFVRFRYLYEKAIILLSTDIQTDDPQPDTLDANAGTDSSEAEKTADSRAAEQLTVLSREQVEDLMITKIAGLDNLASLFNSEGIRRSEMIDCNGKQEKDGLILNAGTWCADQQNVCADMILHSYKKLFGLEISKIREFLENELLVPITVKRLEPKKATQNVQVRGVEVDENMLVSLKKAFSDPELHAEEALICPSGMQISQNSALSEIRELKGGYSVLKVMRDLRVSNAYSIDQAAQYAVSMVQRGSHTIPGSESFPLSVYPEDVACDEAIRNLGDLDDDDAKLFIQYLLSKKDHSRNKTTLMDLPFPDDTLGKVKILLSNELAEKKLQSIVYLYNTGYSSCSWRELCGFMADNSLDYCRLYQVFVQCMFFSQFSRETDERRYVCFVSPESSIIGAEYDILRYPERYALSFPDSRTSKMTKFGPNGFQNVTVTWHVLKAIASQMLPLVRTALGNKTSTKTYCPDEISFLLKCIYTTKAPNDTWYDRSGFEHFFIKGVRSKPMNQLPDAPTKKTSVAHSCDTVLMGRSSYLPHNRRYAYNALQARISRFYGAEVAESICRARVAPVLNRSWQKNSELPPEYRPGMMQKWLQEFSA